ncbi:MAG TPA: organomercurial lyase [Actinomycetota bacterium]|nr:organomercurial lyase [Actinomycetota bacterium]
MNAANDVRVELYRSFVEEQRAPTPAEIATQLGLTTTEVTSRLQELAEAHVIALVPESEAVWLVHPFCALPAPFEVVSGERRWDAICIWDALGILGLVGSDGSVSTSCPDCDQEMRLEVRGGEVAGPAGAVVHYGVPAARWYEDIGDT